MNRQKIEKAGLIFARSYGFTLAEVLITLAIIGIIATLTLPSLIQKHKEKIAVSRLKKVYSTLQQAFISARSVYGEPESWFYNKTISNISNNSEIFAKNIMPYLKVQKDCGFESGCWTKGSIKSLDGTNYVDYDKRDTEYKLILSDGTGLIFYWIFDDTYIIGNVKVDIDGFSGTHTWGKDTFVFLLTKNGFFPAGTSEDEDRDMHSENKFRDSCNLNKSSKHNGAACTAWVIFNENMDYLHCDDLSWDGKHSCKHKK